MQSAILERREEKRGPVEMIRDRIGEITEGMNTEMETFKLSIEKVDGGTAIDFVMRMTVSSKT